MKYKGIIPAKSPLARVVALLTAVLMLVVGVRGEYVYIPVALLIIAACFMKKEHVVSEEGVDIVYNTFGKVSHNVWGWDEITAVYTDRKRAGLHIRVGFTRGTDERAFVLTPEDYEGVLELAKRMNPDIKIMGQEKKDQ